MKYNTAIKEQKAEAFRYFMQLANKKLVIEVKKINPNRTLRQNSYLHLLIAAFGAHFGYTLDEAKTEYKRLVNPSIYIYQKNGNKYLRSSADLNKEEMAQSIDAFMKYSAEQGYPLPKAEDREWLMALENEIERNKYFM